MRTAAKLLALVVVLGVCREAGADIFIVKHYYTFFFRPIGRFGFEEAIYDDMGSTSTALYFGHFGVILVPFTATQGLVGFIVILATSIVLPIVYLVTRRKKRAVP